MDSLPDIVRFAPPPHERKTRDRDSMDTFSEVKLVWRSGRHPPNIVEGRIILTDIEFTYCSNDGSRDLSSTYNAIESVVGGRLDGISPVTMTGTVSPYQYVVDIHFKSCQRWKFLLKSDADSSPSPTGLGGGGAAFLTALGRRRLLRAVVQSRHSLTSPLNATSQPTLNNSSAPTDATQANTQYPASPSLSSPSLSSSSLQAPAVAPESPALTPAAQATVDARSRATDKLLIANVYALGFRMPFDIEEDGWEVYKPEQEFNRMFESISPKYRWTISDVNKDYRVCATYPSVLCFPPSIEPTIAARSAEFRDGGRLPALSWIDPVTLASITRCSQPLPGRLGNTRSREDEHLIHQIFKSNPDHPQTGGYILDARPYQNAMANRALGAGFERTELYMGCNIEFMNIDNIHVVRDSFDKMRRLNRQYLWALNGASSSVPFTSTNHVVPTTGQNSDISPAALGSISLESSITWLSRLADSGWIRHICSVLSGALRIAHLVRRQRVSCVVHCSHGWDRTAQLTSLAQILLDPYYRTLRGFQVLIEKEWVSFGHRFTDRSGHVSGSVAAPLGSNAAATSGTSTKEEAPIFVQFLDCVWQIMQQFPLEFEFNEAYLITIVDELYSCKYGTFLANSERSQRMLNLRQTTASLWSYMNHSSMRPSYLNPLYQPAFVNNDSFIPASASPNKVQFWDSLYNRCENDPTPLQLIIDNYARLQQRVAELEAAAEAATSSASTQSTQDDMQPVARPSTPEAT